MTCCTCIVMYALLRFVNDAGAPAVLTGDCWFGVVLCRAIGCGCGLDVCAPFRISMLHCVMSSYLANRKSSCNAVCDAIVTGCRRVGSTESVA